MVYKTFQACIEIKCNVSPDATCKATLLCNSGCFSKLHICTRNFVSRAITCNNNNDLYIGTSSFLTQISQHGFSMDIPYCVHSTIHHYSLPVSTTIKTNNYLNFQQLKLEMHLITSKPTYRKHCCMKSLA